MAKPAHIQYKSIVKDHIRDIHNYVPTGTYFETLTYTFENNRDYNHRFTETFSPRNNANLYGYTNLRLMGDFDKIKKVELFLGGFTIDSIYPSINDEHRSFSILDKQILPGTLYHEYRLFIDLDKFTTLTVTIDVYKLINPILDNISCEFVFCQNQYNGEGYQETKINTINTYFSFPMKKITIFSLYPLTDLKILLDNRYTFTFKCESLNCEEESLNMFNNLADIPRELCEIIKSYLLAKFNKYVCYFDPSVNFSSVNSGAIIHSTCNKATNTTPNIIHVFGYSQNVFQLNKDMTRQVYAE